MTKPNKKYSFYAIHPDIKEPIQGEMYAQRIKTVLVFIRNRTMDLTNTDENEALKPFKQNVKKLRN